MKKEVSSKHFCLHNKKDHLEGFETKFKHFLANVDSARSLFLLRAGGMGKFCLLPEPIRLQDLLNSTRSLTEKKK